MTLKYYSWPRCIVEAAVGWLVVVPISLWLLNQLQEWVNSGSFNVYHVPLIWRDLGDPISSLFWLFMINLTAGVTRAERKNFFDK
jgi:hypothetical protein